MLIIRKPNGFTCYIFDILRRVFYMGGTSKGGYFSQCYTVVLENKIMEEMEAKIESAIQEEVEGESSSRYLTEIELPTIEDKNVIRNCFFQCLIVTETEIPKYKILIIKKLILIQCIQLSLDQKIFKRSNLRCRFSIT